MAEPTQKEPGYPGAAPGGVSPGTQGAEGRRGALKTLVTIGSIAYAGALVVPAVRFVTGPAVDVGGAGGAARERWVRVGRLDDLPAGEPRRLQIVGDERDAFTISRDQQLGSVWVIREADGKVRAMSATCPHLGCAIDVNPDKKSFACPCHASRFALTGATEAGPSPRGMDPLAARIVDGWVEIDFRRFRQGTVDMQEVSG